MEGLANYGSDDEASSSEESPQRPKELASFEDAITIDKKESETSDNYEDVGMDLSENGSSPSHTPPSQTRNVTTIAHEEERKVVKEVRRRDSRSRSRGKRRRKRSRSRSKSSRSRSKSRSRSRSKSRVRRRDDERREKEKRDKYRKERDRGGSSRSSNRRRSRSRSRSREKTSRDSRRYRDNRDRESRDSRESRDGRDSRENRDSRGENRDSRGDNRDGRDSRREFPAGRYSKRFDRACNKLAHLEKMGIDVNKSQEKKDVSFFQTQSNAPHATTNFVPAGGGAAGRTSEDRLLPPGVTGRLREQMERRKALWQKKPEGVDVQEVQAQAPNTSGKVWQATTFAHDQEGKQANKFKRLMGIRETPSAAGDKSTDSLAKKQEELFSSMEQQYEVARTATHTMRGVGLGFGSYQR